MKLELKHLAPYLPYGLNFFCEDLESGEYDILPLTSVSIVHEEFSIGNSIDIDLSEMCINSAGMNIKPILRPLLDPIKDITEEIEAVVGYKFSVNKNFDGQLLLTAKDKGRHLFLNEIMQITEILFKHHYDVFGLIEKKLAIDIDTLKN